MVPLNQLTKETILSSKVLAEVFDQEDELYRAELLASLSMRATELKVKTEFREMVRVYKKVDSETKKKKQKTAMAENWTHFSDHKYEPMKCGQWIVTDEGVRLLTVKARCERATQPEWVAGSPQGLDPEAWIGAWL